MVTIGHAEVLMRTYFSTYHLWAAEHFARLAANIEGAHTGKPTFNIKHRAYVTSSILSAVAFLEAAINEFFDDVTDGHSGYVDPTTDYARQLAELWKEKMGSDGPFLRNIKTRCFARARMPLKGAHSLIRTQRYWLIFVTT
jgi:hypothetical protein